MMKFEKLICPKCKEKLTKSNNSLLCVHGHCFDISSRGYVNLLLSSASLHGDSKEMLDARVSLLSSGAYLHLSEKLCALALEYVKDKDTVVDLGCGTGYYIKNIAGALKKENVNADIYAYDVSKDAVAKFSKGDIDVSPFVASSSEIPLADESVDFAILVFSPMVLSEFSRIIKKGAKLVIALPNPKHLYELKEKIYDTPYENTVENTALSGFKLLSDTDVCRKIELKGNLISDLFMMTPYYFRTSEADKEKIKFLDSIGVSADFKVLCYEKI